MCNTSCFIHFCQEILQLVLPHGYITKPVLICWIERACIVVFRFYQRALRKATGISGPRYHYRLTVVFVVADSSGMIFVALALKTKYFSPLVVILSWKVTGVYRALVFTASLSEVENGVKPCRTRLSGVFRLSERNQSLSRKIFQGCT